MSQEPDLGLFQNGFEQEAAHMFGCWDITDVFVYVFRKGKVKAQ